MNYPNYYGYQPYQAPMPDQLAQLRGMQVQQAPMAPQSVSMPLIQTQQGSGVVWVNNEMEAEQYPVAPNNSVVLWVINAPVIYLKQANASGKPNTQIYDLVERTAAPAAAPAPAVEYVPLEAFKRLEARVEALAAPKTNKKTKDKEEIDNE